MGSSSFVAISPSGISSPSVPGSASALGAPFAGASVVCTTGAAIQTGTSEATTVAAMRRKLGSRIAPAVAIQRQAGGDLAEILDKIGHIVRERFKILGQVQALTGEGRMSGIVLMALPIGLFFAVWHLNAEYVMLLFTDEIGRQMVAVAAVLQVLGAVCIKKIITIKV